MSTHQVISSTDNLHFNRPLHHRNVNRYEYGWADSVEIKKPIKVSAPKYVDYLMDWITVQLDDEKIFLQKLGMC
ncbi:hypothetical protein GIB67_005855 [Kingdonia uniflora]|uniref:Uncharacterized protein n=1 Tax=Kingdonia uniflora TaxID=39325 RepID=A0A7J7M552_9MAGN|nr:hypothetical protein GIB67_005855 [Kingdonia uniflora]